MSLGKFTVNMRYTYIFSKAIYLWHKMAKWLKREY